MERHERRNGTSAVPDDLHIYLTEDQQNKYHNLHLHGWRYMCVRRPLFQRPICLMTNRNQSEIAVFEVDGTLSKESSIPLRSA